MSMPRPNWKLTAEHLALENERLRAALEAAEESLATFIGKHGDDGAGSVLAQVRAALK